MFERVVIALNGSPPPKALAQAARTLTYPRKSEITVLTVRPASPGLAAGREPVEIAPGPSDSAEIAAGILRKSGYRARARIHQVDRGGVADEIIRYVDEHGPDLLVMGSRGLTDLQALVTASVSHQVLAHVLCPVLIVREGAELDPPRRLLLAFDDSNHSRRAARVAADLARSTGAEVEVVSVKRPLLAEGAFVIDTEDCRRRVDHLVAGLREEVVASGSVKVSISGRAPAIVQAAEEAGADLIVMGSRGLSRIAGAVIGSVSHEVIHLSNRQVLLVP